MWRHMELTNLRMPQRRRNYMYAKIENKQVTQVSLPTTGILSDCEAKGTCNHDTGSRR